MSRGFRDPPTTLRGGYRNNNACTKCLIQRGGCFHQFGEEAYNPIEQIAGVEGAIKSVTQTAGWLAGTIHAGLRGLTVPMRSSIVRGMLKAGERSGEILTLLLMDFEEGVALYNEIKSLRNGECQ